jgi:hypothetical protein
MLPGFRFLFTAIILSMSILIFGLGAAALLRAAHEEFANLPSRRSTPEPMFARRTDDTPPTLALLRIETPVAENLPTIPAVPEAAAEASSPAGQAQDTSPAEPEQLAALKAAEPIEAEVAKPEATAKEAIVDTAAAPAAKVEVLVTNAEVKVAAADTPQPAAAPTAPPPEVYSVEGNPAATRIATLGGPAVIVDEKAAASTSEAKTEAKPDRSALKKQAAERARERRRIAAARRARLAREATLTLQQQQPNPLLPFPGMPATR